MIPRSIAIGLPCGSSLSLSICTSSLVYGNMHYPQICSLKMHILMPFPVFIIPKSDVYIVYFCVATDF
jgi:hypothetical protein